MGAGEALDLMVYKQASRELIMQRSLRWDGMLEHTVVSLGPIPCSLSGVKQRLMTRSVLSPCRLLWPGL